MSMRNTTNYNTGLFSSSSPVWSTATSDDRIPDGITFVVISVSYGGWGVSAQCFEEINRRRVSRGEEPYPERWRDRERNDFRLYTDVDQSEFDAERRNPDLLALLKEKGSKWCSGRYARLTAKPFPDSMRDYVEINDYDGHETLTIDYDMAFWNGTEDILKRDDASIEDVRQLYETIESTKELVLRISKEFNFLLER